MPQILLQLLPIFVYIALGILIREKGLADKSHGDFLLRLVFFVTLPLLILGSVSQVEFTTQKAILPLLNILVNFCCFGVATLLCRSAKLNRAATGSVLVSTSIINNAFMFPFVLAVYGAEGFADSVLWDFGNAIMTATFIYAVALHHGGKGSDAATMIRRIVFSPLVWALAVSVALALSNTPMPAMVSTIITPLGQMTAPLILIAMGIHTTLRIQNPGLALKVAGIRMLFGLMVGLLLATLFGLEGTTFKVVVLCSAAPIGFMALAYSSLAKLDTELTSGAVSLSILAGIVWIPLMVLLLEQFA